MPKAILLDGKKLSQKILQDLKEEITALKKKPRLVVVLVGGNPISLHYIRQKEKAAKKVGIRFRLKRFPQDISTRKLRKELSRICRVKTNTAVMVQLPLPQHLNKQYILNTIPPAKDVDILSITSLGRLFVGQSLLFPPTVGGILRLLEEYGINIKGKHVVIVGSGTLVGKPLSIIMMAKGATVTVCNKFTRDLARLTSQADILISGVGKARLIRGTMVKEGAVVIDAGCAEIKGKIEGDVDFQEVSQKTSYITPVPGGVGPMTVAMLLQNIACLTPGLNRSKCLTTTKSTKPKNTLPKKDWKDSKKN